MQQFAQHFICQLDYVANLFPVQTVIVDACHYSNRTVSGFGYCTDPPLTYHTILVGWELLRSKDTLRIGYAYRSHVGTFSPSEQNVNAMIQYRDVCDNIRAEQCALQLKLSHAIPSH